MKVKRIDKLTAAQEARFAEWRDKWIEIGLSTKPADRARFEAAIPACYCAAGLAPPTRIVWVTSPIVGALAFSAAALILALRSKKVDRGAVDGAVDGAVAGAVDEAVGVAVTLAVRGAVRGAVCAAVDDAVRDAVGDAVGGAVDEAVGVAVTLAVRGAVRGAVCAAVDDAVRAAVDGAVGGAVRDAVGDAVRGAVGDAVGGVDDAVRDAVGDAVRGAVGDAVGVAVRDAVRGVVDDAYRTAFLRMWSHCIGGQFWVGGWHWGSPSYVSFFREVCGLDLSEDIAQRALAYEDTARSASWWWPHKDFVMVSERPRVLARDAQGRLHREDGPAAEWGDGWGVYRWHGINVPAGIIEHPENITVERIHAQSNEEIRRVMVERYGLARYVRDAQFEVVDQDVDPVGQPRRLLRRDDLLVVELVNSTVDADGTRRLYHVPCHPELRPLLPDGSLGRPQKLTALNAVASTYGLTGEEYLLEVET